MGKVLFLLFVFMTVIASNTGSYAEDIATPALLLQMDQLQDSSILHVAEGRCYLNLEKIDISDDKIRLHSDFFGPLSVLSLLQDSEDVYLTLYGYFTCDRCGTAYSRQPLSCTVCGGKSFTFHGQSPGNED